MYVEQSQDGLKYLKLEFFLHTLTFYTIFFKNKLSQLSPNTVSVLGRDEGYTVKYNPLLEGILRAKPEGTPKGKGLYLTIYPESGPNTDII